MRCYLFFVGSRRRDAEFKCGWSSDVCSSDLRFSAHGPGDGDGFAVDDSHGVSGRLVWARRSEVSRAETESCTNESENPRDSNRMEKGSHCVILPVTSAETLTYTIRVPPPGRT